MNWIKTMLKNSPSPAFQLPYFAPKELFIPEVIKKLSQESRPTPLALNKGVPIGMKKDDQKFPSNASPKVTVQEKSAAKKSEGIKKTAYNNKGKSVAEVIELQRKLGVAADGKWGANTQRAYETSMMDQKAKDADLGPIRTRPGNIKSEKPKQKLASNWLPPDYKQKGGTLTNAADSTKHFNDKLKNSIKEHFNAKTSSDKEVAVKKVNQTKANLLRQENKNKVGFDKNGGEMPKGGDQAAIYKKGKDVKVPKKGKIDASKWKK